MSLREKERERGGDHECKLAERNSIVFRFVWKKGGRMRWAIVTSTPTSKSRVGKYGGIVKIGVIRRSEDLCLFRSLEDDTLNGK